MEFVSIINVIPPTVTLFLAVYVFCLGWKERSIQLLILLLLALTAYGIADVLKHNQPDINGINEMARYKTAFWGLIIPFAFHTLVALTKENKRIEKFILGYLYLYGAVLIILSLLGYNAYKDHYLVFWGWEGVMDTGNWFFWVFIVYIFTGTIVLFFTLFFVQKLTNSYRIHKLFRAMLIFTIHGERAFRW